jgi:ABC-type Zn uptake system ZnuABC Zn-binding protein ZnuA
MKRKLSMRSCFLRAVCALAAVQMAAAGATAPGSGLPTEESLMIVAATIPPLSKIIRAVGGSDVEVRTILPPGGNPHTFEPSPVHLKQLRGSQAVFLIGHGLDEWAAQIVSGLSGAASVNVDEGVALLGAGRGDPHYWLAIDNAKQMARNIARYLSKQNPSRKERYASNTAAFELKLDQTKRDIRHVLKGIPRRQFASLHRAWAYFAAENDLEVIGYLASEHGGGTTPRYLAKMADTVKERRIHVLIVEPNTWDTLAETFSSDFGLQIVEINPMGKNEMTDYPEMMLDIAKTFKEALDRD